MKIRFVLLWLVVVVACRGCQVGRGPQRPVVGITSVYKVSKASGSASTSVGFAYVRADLDYLYNGIRRLATMYAAGMRFTAR